MSIILKAKEALKMEANAIFRVADTLDGSFEAAVNFLLNVEGRVITSGIGKSGHIARKSAATFASTGTPSFFVDPAECMHGDFGMITNIDVMLLFSKSGEVSEMTNIINWLSRQNIPYIAITNEADSIMAKHAYITLLTHIDREACLLNLAPTSSSTVSLALSDALAIAIMDKRGFDKFDFAKFHPGGSLGKQATTIEHIMHTTNLPIVAKTSKLRDAINVMINHNLGLLIVLDNEILQGILVDGDFKRILSNPNNDISKVMDLEISEFINKNPITITKDALIGDALTKMEGRITSLIVTDDLEHKKFVGVLHIHDILKYKAI